MYDEITKTDGGYVFDASIGSDRWLLDKNGNRINKKPYSNNYIGHKGETDWDDIKKKYNIETKEVTIDGLKQRIFFIGGIAVVKNKNNKFNLMKKDSSFALNKWVDKVFNIKEGCFLIRDKGKYNFVNDKGNLLSKSWFDKADSFNSGFAKVVKDNKINFINLKGEILNTTWFDSFLTVSEYIGEKNTSINNIYGIVHANGKVGLITNKGKLSPLGLHKKSGEPGSFLRTYYFLNRIIVASLENLSSINNTLYILDGDGKQIFDKPFSRIGISNLWNDKGFLSVSRYKFSKEKWNDGKTLERCNLIDTIHPDGKFLLKKWYKGDPGCLDIKGNTCYWLGRTPSIYV